MYQSGFTGARDTEWQWHQLGHMQICTSPQTHNHASIPPLSFLQARCPSCCAPNSIKALKAFIVVLHPLIYFAYSVFFVNSDIQMPLLTMIVYFKTAFSFNFL